MTGNQFLVLCVFGIILALNQLLLSYSIRDINELYDNLNNRIDVLEHQKRRNNERPDRQ